jgi:hypothetical protein
LLSKIQQIKNTLKKNYSRHKKKYKLRTVPEGRERHVVGWRPETERHADWVRHHVNVNVEKALPNAKNKKALVFLRALREQENNPVPNTA